MRQIHTSTSRSALSPAPAQALRLLIALGASLLLCALPGGQAAASQGQTAQGPAALSSGPGAIALGQASAQGQAITSSQRAPAFLTQLSAEGGGLTVVQQSEERLELLSERIFGRIGSPGVAADLYELMEEAAVSGPLERVAELLSRVARSGRALPEVRALARRQLAEVERWRGRLPRMEQSLAALGTITSLTLVGPFDDENKGGYDVAYGPEEELDLSKTYPGLRADVGWRRLEGLGQTGPIVLHQAVRPTNGILVYALATLEAPAATEATLYLGTPGAAKGWLNGKAILADPSYHSTSFDQRSLPLRLQRGENVLLLKLAAGESGPFELELRVVGADGNPIRGLRVQAPSAGRWAAPEAIPVGKRIIGKRPLVDPLEALAKTNPSPRTLEDLARVLGARRPFDDAAELHIAAAERAAFADPKRVEAQLLAASFHEEDRNRRRYFLERALEAELPGRATAHAALAQFRLEQGDSFQAIELLLSRLPQAPGDWQAAVVLSKALDRRGEQAAAIRLLDSLIERSPSEPALLLERAAFHRRDRQLDDAIRLLRVVLAYRPADRAAVSALVGALVQRGSVDEAVERLAEAARLQPIDLGMLLRRAELLAANGALPAAQRLFAQAERLCPQEAEIFAKAGHAALRGGEKEAAIVAFERALSLRPQDASMRELLESIREGESSFALPFLRDLRQVAEAARGSFPNEDAVKLVDLTAVRVLPSGQASRTVQTIVQVRTQRGVDRYRSSMVRYAPGRDALKIKRARVLREDGTIVDSHTESDRSLNEPWSGLYYDARASVIGFPSLAVGDTVELVYRLDDIARDNLLSDYFGDVDFLADTVPTVDWEYVAEMPRGRPLFSNAPGEAARSEEAREGGATLYRWSARDLPRLIPEPQMPGWSEVAPYLHVSTYSDWDSVGRFWWGLVKDQVEPTPEIERVAKAVVKGIPEFDDAKRVQAIYDFVATKTRYVGLEFGIHSFKPYKVEQVLRRGFGDCKDKASLTYSLLRSIGIESKLVLLRMRQLGTMGSEPASLAVFNHAILYVPSLDLYLDGTAEWSGSRELPEADRGADILIVEPEGGSRFATTPEAPAELSTTSTTYRVSLEADGSASLVGESQVAGLAAAGYRQAYAAPSGRAASFEKSWARSFPGVEVARFDLSDPRQLEEDVELSYDLSIPGYADVSLDGSLHMTPTRSAGGLVESFAALSSRRYDLVLRYPWTTRFRYEIELPPGYVATGLPEKQRERSEFGSLDLSYSVEGESVVIEGEIVVSRSRIRPAEYQAFRSFLARVDGLLSKRVVAAPGEG